MIAKDMEVLQVMEETREIEVQADDKRPIILAIDDVPEILRMIHLVLRDDYKVYTLSEPEKLEEILMDITPELFILDYIMPEMDGFDLMPIIRSYQEHSETPIIYLTSVKSADFYSVAMRLGASDYIMKPIDADKLREKVGRHFT